LSQLAKQQAGDEVLFCASAAAEEIAQPLLARSCRPCALERRDLRERFVHVVQAERRRVGAGNVPRVPDCGAADPDATLARFARKKSDRDLDLLRRYTTKQIGEQADLREAAARLTDGRARGHEIVERHC
jgi:hypothetical protein